MYVWIFLTLRQQPSCMIASGYPNAGPRMLWPALRSMLSTSSLPSLPHSYSSFFPESSMPLHSWASVLLSPLHPLAFFSLLGGHLTLSSCALPVLVPLHRESLQDSPSLSSRAELALLGFCTVPSPSPFYFPRHIVSLINTLSPWLSPCLRLRALTHASEMGIGWMLLQCTSLITRPSSW